MHFALINHSWYPAQYVSMLGSIFPLGDICKLIPDEDADYCILEEPEHLNWFRPEGEGEIWTEKFTHVVGVIHTNYRVRLLVGFLRSSSYYCLSHYS